MSDPAHRAGDVVHLVGLHVVLGRKDHREVFAECDWCIGVVATRSGFYPGNTADPVNCIACLVLSNFGMYAPR